MLVDYVLRTSVIAPDTQLIGHADINCSIDQVTALDFSSFILEFSFRIIKDITPNPNEALCFPLRFCKPICPACQI